MDTLDSRSVKKNFIYQASLKVITFVLTLVITVYIARVLNSELLGMYGYSYAIVSIFVYICSAIGCYGTRELSYRINDTKKASILFWEISILKFIFSLILFIPYLVFFIILNSDDNTLFIIQIINYAGIIFEITWFFTAQERFRSLAIINIILKVLQTVMIFIFVRSTLDLYNYVIIQSVYYFLTCTIMIFGLKKYLVKVSIKEINITRHLKGCFIIMIPFLALEIFTYMDKAMLGWLGIANTEIGYYDQADKLMKSLLEIIVLMKIVQAPRMTKYYLKGDNENINDLLSNAFSYLFLVATPLIVGVDLIARRFTLLYFGEGYDGIPNVLLFLSISLALKGFNDIIANQYLIPTSHHILFNIATIVAAITNLIINYLLIPQYLAIGACIGTIISEFIIFLFLVIGTRKEIKCLPKVLKCWKYIVSALIMGIVVFIMNKYFPVSNLHTILLIIIAGIVYVLSLIILHDKYFYELIKMVFSRIKREEEPNEEI